MIPLHNNFFWTGIVENTQDPDRLGRVQVRIFNIHTDNKTLLPTADLFWADVCQPIFSAAISGKGLAPVGLVEGSMVGGIFKDPEGMQEPIVWFSMGGMREVNVNSTLGFNDPMGLYPTPNVQGDVNIRAGGLGNTGAMNARTSNAIGTQTVSSDPLATTTSLSPDDLKKAPWIPIAQSYLGINEEKNASQIKEFLKVGGGLSASETVAWCAAYANYCLQKAGVQGTRSAAARSFLNWGQQLPLTNIPFGAIVVFAGSRGPSSGHVAFCLKDNGSTVQCIGGNQTTQDGKKFDTGGMVTSTNFKRDKIIGVRFPVSNNAIKTNTTPDY